MLRSYHYPPPPPPPRNCSFSILCVCGGMKMCLQQVEWVPFFASVLLVVPQPVSVHVLNLLTNHNVRFSFHSYVSLRGETTCFQSFQIAMPKRKLKASSWVINLIKQQQQQQQNTHQTFQEAYIYRKVFLFLYWWCLAFFSHGSLRKVSRKPKQNVVLLLFLFTLQSAEKFLCIVRSVQSTQHVKCSACFLGLFCCPWWNVRHSAVHQLEVLHQQRKSNRKYTEYFPFYGLWDAIFTAFGCNSSRYIFAAKC